MKLKLISALAMACAAPLAYAEAMPIAGVSGYVTSESVDAGGSEPDGTGFGVKGWVGITGGLFLAGEYQSVELEESGAKVDLDQWRLGAGYWLPVNEYFSVYGLVEAINAEISGGGESLDGDGMGFHIGGMLQATPQYGVYLSLGQVDIEDSDGLEFQIGNEFMITRQVGGFVELRLWNAQDGDLSDLRAGLSYYFEG